MKKIITLLVLTIFANMALSQSNVYLKINHKLGSDPFTFTTVSSNDRGDFFDVKRLQYYLTPYSITHDGGMTTLLNNTLLIDANIPTNELLGNFMITNIEKITFAIGVDSSLNHLDPALATGALAPKSPSMHWGWAPGYRFIAYEGKANTTSPPTQNYELHALGDHNYHYITITTSGTSDASGLTVELNADYTAGLSRINVASGLLEHGETANTSKLIDNFKNKVFTSVEGNPSVGIETINEPSFSFVISPNPVMEGSPIVLSTSEFLENSQVVVTDIQGRQVMKKLLDSDRTTLSNVNAGTYIVSIFQGGKYMASRKLIITNSNQ
ncbi:MAG: MbnP family protein [Flavobacteriales bacterium]